MRDQRAALRQVVCLLDFGRCRMPVHAQSLGHVQLFAALWMVGAPLSMGFSQQEYWDGLSFPPPGDLPDSGIEPVSLISSELTGRFFIMALTRKPCDCLTLYINQQISSVQYVQGIESGICKNTRPPSRETGMSLCHIGH